MRRPEHVALWAIVIAFAVLYALVGLIRHWHFGSGYDLAIFDQAVWHLSRWERPESTLSGYANILGDHFYPIIALWAPLYWIAPAPETLIAAQGLLLALSFVPVHRLLRDRLAPGPAFTLLAAYGVFWGMQRTAISDVHELAFAPLLIAWAIVALDRRRWWLLWLSSLGIVLVKEDMIPMPVAFGCYLVYRGERARGTALALAGIAIFLTVLLVIIPWFAGAGGWAHGGSFSAALESPWRIPLLLVTPVEKLRTIAYWLAPFGFLPLASPLGALLVPVAAERLLSSLSFHWGHGFHYSAPLAPILAVAAGDGLARLAARLRHLPTSRRLLRGMPAMCLVVSLLVPGHQPLLRLFRPSHYAPFRSEDTARRALARIPAGASVVTQASIAPHLSQRPSIHVLQDGAPEADVVVISTALDPWPAANTDDLMRLVDERRRRGYRVAFAEGDWLVLAR